MYGNEYENYVENFKFNVENFMLSFAIVKTAHPFLRPQGLGAWTNNRLARCRPQSPTDPRGRPRTHGR